MHIVCFMAFHGRIPGVGRVAARGYGGGTKKAGRGRGTEGRSHAACEVGEGSLKKGKNVMESIPCSSVLRVKMAGKTYAYMFIFCLQEAFCLKFPGNADILFR